MSSKRDYYQVLGVGRDADAAAIKSGVPEAGGRSTIPTATLGTPRRRNGLRRPQRPYDILSDETKREAVLISTAMRHLRRGREQAPEALGRGTRSTISREAMWTTS